MKEILITLLLFGLAVLLAATRYDPSRPVKKSENRDLTSDRVPTDAQSTEKNHPVPETTPSVAESAIPAVTDSAPAQPLIVPPFLEPEADVSLPLAASLPLQEAIQPKPSDVLPDLIPGTSTIIEATAETGIETGHDRDQQNVLEEIAQLGEGISKTAIADLTRHAYHADSMVRAAVALTLGERATQDQGHLPDEWLALLNQLLQDSHAEVRRQAATALGKIQHSVDLI